MKIFKYWLPVGMMFSLMYYFSTDVFSVENTRSIVDIVFGWFMPEVGIVTIATTTHFVRKFAHCAEYALLAILLFRAFRAGSPVCWRLEWTLYSLVVILGWALLDEFHQLFTATRGASIYDSLLDSASGLITLMVIARNAIAASAAKASAG